MGISEQCFRTVDLWLDIAKEFAVLKGMIMAGKEYPDMEIVFGNLVLTEDYGFSQGIVSKEDREVSHYHRDRIKSLLGSGVGAVRATEDAVMWAGRTFADKAVDCECGKREAP